MVKKITKKKWVNILGGAVIILIFLLLLAKHYNFNYSVIPQTVNNIERRITVLANVHGLIDSCEQNEKFVYISGDAYVCGKEGENTLFDYIYTTYPKSINGRERAYEFLDTGDRAVADKMLDNTFDLARYKPVEINNLDWTEDPFGERYWRFIFYSLRPTRHLLATARETNGDRYYSKFRSIISSFIEEGSDEVYAWDDIHGAAFRSMILTNSWWKLREENELPNDLSDKILGSLIEHAEFLMQPENFESENNHGITEAMALYLIGSTFPDLPNAQTWKQTAQRRIEENIDNIVDEDGALVENSPYYHYYALEKYWEIYKYFNKHDLDIGDNFTSRVEKMFGYATYILQPDNNPPLIGASIPRDIRMTGEFREIAEIYPPFRYVLTQGKEGEKPEHKNIVYPSSGQVIMRSGWGENRPYIDETFLVFDMGPYRTDHSELDALNFHLYSKGSNIIRDTGLYTYETDNPLYNYFYGTRGHNTVMVDGQNQDRGEPVAGTFQEGDTWAWQSAYHSLYPDVVHHRAIALIEDNVVLIIDELDGTVNHTYEQLFHLAPETDTQMQDLTLRAETEEENIPFAIHQLVKEDISVEVVEGEEDRGLCSTVYEEKVDCPEIAYVQEGMSAQFITLITIGDEDVSYELTAAQGNPTITIQTKSAIYEIPVSYTGKGRERQIVLDINQEDSADSQQVWEKLMDSLRKIF